MEHTLSAYSLFLRNSFTDFCGRRLQEEGLSQGLLYFILYVGKHPECAPGTLASAIGADAGYTTRSVDRLIQNGFMEKRRSQSDRRFSHLYLTDRGEEIFQLAYQLFHAWDETVMKELTEEEKQSLLSLLSRVAAGLKP